MPAQLDEAVAVAHVGDEDGHGHDVRERAAGGLERELNVVPHLCDLTVEVPFADQPPLVVHRRHPRHEDQGPAGYFDGRGVGAGAMPGTDRHVFLRETAGTGGPSGATPGTARAAAGRSAAAGHETVRPGRGAGPGTSGAARPPDRNCRPSAPSWG